MQIADGFGVGQSQATSRDILRDDVVELADGPVRGLVYALLFEAVFVAAVYLLIRLLLLL